MTNNLFAYKKIVCMWMLSPEKQEWRCRWNMITLHICECRLICSYLIWTERFNLGEPRMPEEVLMAVARRRKFVFQWLPVRCCGRRFWTRICLKFDNYWTESNKIGSIACQVIILFFKDVIVREFSRMLFFWLIFRLIELRWMWRKAGDPYNTRLTSVKT